MKWLDDNPYFLMIATERSHVEIDLGEKGWATKYSTFMREPGNWYLCRKPEGVIAAVIVVNEGDQPYYVARHVGFAGMDENAPGRETIVYGIGKKRPDGFTERIWLLGNGAVTVGEDMEQLAIALLKAGFL